MFGKKIVTWVETYSHSQQVDVMPYFNGFKDVNRRHLNQKTKSKHHTFNPTS